MFCVAVPHDITPLPSLIDPKLYLNIEHPDNLALLVERR
jgi:hypothetical protein